LNLEDAHDAQSVVSKSPGLSITPTLRHYWNGDEAKSHVERSGENDQGLTSTNHTELISSVSFESDLDASFPYRRARRHSMDFSFRSSIAQSNAWSLFSELSIGHVSTIAVIALPIYADEIANSHHYEFHSQQPVPLPAMTVIFEPVHLCSSFLGDCVEIKLRLL